MLTFLHVGCGPKRKDDTTPGFARPEWSEIRFDIAESAQPDVVGTMTDMSAVASESVDAVFSSHSLEHLFPHEVPLALAEFRRVLKPSGFAVITCPDIESVAALIVEGKFVEPAYHSSAGPIAPIDILFGHRAAIARGEVYMAHRCGFTQKVLAGSLGAAGFGTVAVRQRARVLDLWAVATSSQVPEEDARQLMANHFPPP